MTADRSAILAALIAVESLLRRYKVRYEPVVRGMRERVETEADAKLSDQLRLEVRRMFGGMGSLNDVYISKLNGNPVEDERDANRRLDRLTTELWKLVADAEEEKGH